MLCFGKCEHIPYGCQDFHNFLNSKGAKTLDEFYCILEKKMISDSTMQKGNKINYHCLADSLHMRKPTHTHKYDTYFMFANKYSSQIFYAQTTYATPIPESVNMRCFF